MMDERILKEALFEADTVLVGAYEDGKYIFGERVMHNIEKLFYKEKHPSVRVMKNVAAVILAFILSGAIILGINEPARAAVISWISEVFEGTFLYIGQYDSDLNVSGYSVRNIITSEFEYVEAESYYSDKEVCETFVDSDGYYLYFYAIRATENEVEQLLVDKEDKLDRIRIENYSIDYYTEPGGESNAYIWHDKNGTLFYLGGRISSDELENIAKMFICTYN